jgi:hypothetical protein
VQFCKWFLSVDKQGVYQPSMEMHLSYVPAFVNICVLCFELSKLWELNVHDTYCVPHLLFQYKHNFAWCVTLLKLLRLTDFSRFMCSSWICPLLHKNEQWLWRVDIICYCVCFIYFKSFKIQLSACHVTILSQHWIKDTRLSTLLHQSSKNISTHIFD